MVDRPTILALNTVLHFPEYMGLPEPRVGPPQVADVTELQASCSPRWSSQAEWKV